MQINPYIKNALAFGIILLFVGMNITSIVSSLSIEKHFSINGSTEKLHTVMNAGLRGINITLNGTMGENGWYISDVYVSINCSESNHTYFRIDEEGWQEYVVPFVITTDGYYTVSCYYIDSEGHHSDTYYASFKIDQTPPDWEGVIFDKIGLNKYRIHAEVSDETSGVYKVEFYLNLYLIFTDYEAPYEWIYKGPSFDHASVAFDIAGNSNMCPYIPFFQNYFGIGFINNPQFCRDYVTFFAKFVIVYEHDFPIFRISTLTNQQFAIPTDYTGHISENFMIVKYKD